MLHRRLKVGFVFGKFNGTGNAKKWLHYEKEMLHQQKGQDREWSDNNKQLHPSGIDTRELIAVEIWSIVSDPLSILARFDGGRLLENYFGILCHKTAKKRRH